MKIHYFLVLIILLAGLKVQAQPTIYIVRHAEKLADWPGDSLDSFHPLSQAGIARAEQLAERLGDIPFSAIYSSLTTRTLHTAFPLAQKLKLPIKIALACMDTSKISAFYDDLAQRFNEHKSVLLVSHSNIIPYLLKKAGLLEKCYPRMGIIHSTSTSWLLIQGYDNIWKIEGSGDKLTDCGRIKKMQF